LDLVDLSVRAKAHGTKAPSIADVLTILNNLKPAPLIKRLDPLMREQIKNHGTKKLGELGLSLAFDLLNPRVTEYMAEFTGKKITAINDTTMKRIRKALIAGVEEGEGTKDLARRIREVFGEASKYRSLMIARTESVGGANFAAQEAYEQSGVVDEKEWVTTLDDKTRDDEDPFDHAAMDGVRVALRDPFIVSGEELMQPGDSRGSAANIINCRCTVIAAARDANELSRDARAAYWKAFDADARAWERLVIVGVRAAFADQEKALLVALDEVTA